MAKQNIMTVASLKKLLKEFGNEISDDFQVWLSSDEEGNEFLPVFDNPQLCLAIEPHEKRIILFPSHQ
ncbi:MAG: hypothetical protein FJ263_03760 [Planctomycetes bacterium]|nr:hypothetical protein [Planctomycetota bacterium]